MAASDFIIESRTIAFTGNAQVTVVFSKTHYHAPVVSLLPTEDVNVKTRSLSATGCVLESSGIFTGDIHMQAISKKV